jgi:uncharacterized protein YueI
MNLYYKEYKECKSKVKKLKPKRYLLNIKIKFEKYINYIFNKETSLIKDNNNNNDNDYDFVSNEEIYEESKTLMTTYNRLYLYYSKDLCYGC